MATAWRRLVRCMMLWQKEAFLSTSSGSAARLSGSLPLPSAFAASSASAASAAYLAVCSNEWLPREVFLENATQCVHALVQLLDMPCILVIPSQ